MITKSMKALLLALWLFLTSIQLVIHHHEHDHVDFKTKHEQCLSCALGQNLLAGSSDALSAKIELESPHFIFQVIFPKSFIRRVFSKASSIKERGPPFSPVYT